MRVKNAYMDYNKEKTQLKIRLDVNTKLTKVRIVYRPRYKKCEILVGKGMLSGHSNQGRNFLCLRNGSKRNQRISRVRLILGRRT